MSRIDEFLVEMDAVWAEVLLQILKDHHIPCVSFPVHGAGLVMWTGIQERRKIYVPPEMKAEAEEILNAFFAENEEEPQA